MTDSKKGAVSATGTGEWEGPDYFIAFGWHSFPSLRGVAKLSACHLADRVQGPLPWSGLCGARMSGRGLRRDDGMLVLDEVRSGERKPCKKCWNIASARTSADTQSTDCPSPKKKDVSDAL